MFEIAGSKDIEDIGQYFEKEHSSSFLYRGITLAILSMSEKIPHLVYYYSQWFNKI